MTMLVLHSEEEKYDIAEWMQSHAEEDYVPPHMKDAAIWLGERDPEGYPAFFDVPLKFVDALDFGIEDWAEVLGSHDEESYTTLITAPENQT